MVRGMRSPASSFFSTRRVLFLGMTTTIVSAAAYAGCGGNSTNATTSGGDTSSATTTTSSAGGGGSTSSSTTTSSTGDTTSSTTSTTSSTSSTSSSSTSTSTTSGTGGAGGGWPTCDAPEPGAVQKTIHQIYLDDPAAPTQVWVPGVYVTAVSQGGCQSGVACQIYVQQDLVYADLAAGSQQAIKLFVSANTADHFLGVQVGQKVDVDGFAWRYNVNGEDELLLQVNLQLKGCAKPVGTGDAQPVTATLSQLMFPSYDSIGPLLVKVNGPSGTPQAPDQTFGLFMKGMFVDAGPDNVVSLSPFFLTGGMFTTFTQFGHVHDFTSVTGVFGIFVPTASTQKYREIYPRTATEYPISKVN